MSLEIGQLIEGKYRIVRLIGEGGMGAVYEGENVRINRRVAIKVLHSAFTGNAEVMQRFEREAQAAGRIGNDHILEVLDLGSLSDGDHYIVMEYLDGEPLSSRIKARGRMAPYELTPIIRQVLVGLHAAHQAGIVHRDLKPDNIYILKEKAGTSDFVKLIDFGISKFQPLAGDGMKMTRTGAVMGTPYYMSPEQASGSHEADQRSDLYSMGVILFEAVTGRVPFEAATFNQLMFKIVLAEVPMPESIVPDLDAAFSSIIAKAMARDVNHRFQDAPEFIRALDAWMARGAAVLVPPGVGAAAAGLATGRAADVDGRAPGTGTAGTWARSQPDGAPEVVPVTRPRGIVAALGFAGALLLVGGGFAVYKALSAAPEASAVERRSTEPASASLPAAAPAPVLPPAPVPLATAIEPVGNAQAPEPLAPAGADRPSTAMTTPSAAATLRRPAARPAAKPAAAPAKSPPSSKPAAKPATPDFGY